MPRVFVIGPAGSGKSTLVAALADYMESQGVPVTKVNLDPAAEYTPYLPDVDVRTYVYARRVMEEYDLGPNGAIIASIDLMLNHLEELKEEMGGEEGFTLIDTPGQMEVFVFRRSGEAIVHSLAGERPVVLFVHDAVLTTSPSAFLSQSFLAASTYYRLRIATLNVFNKADLIDGRHAERIVDWIRDPERLVQDLERELRGLELLMSIELHRVLRGFMDHHSAFIASAKTSQGLDRIYAALERVYTGGDRPDLREDFERYRFEEDTIL